MDYCFFACRFGGIFRGCSENRTRRRLACDEICFAEGARSAKSQSSRAHFCSVNSRHGIRNTAQMEFRVILRNGFCSDFETRLPTSRMHSSLTAIHHRHGHQVRCSAVARNVDVGHGSGSKSSESWRLGLESKRERLTSAERMIRRSRMQHNAIADVPQIAESLYTSPKSPV